MYLEDLIDQHLTNEQNREKRSYTHYDPRKTG